MQHAAGQTQRRAVIGLLVAAVVLALGALVYKVFFYQPAEAREIGWVLEVTGDGWTLKSDTSKMLKVGDRLQAGGTLVPKANDKLTTITVCDFEGNPKCYVGIDGPQILPTATLANFGSKLWRRIADSYEPKDIHAISRGNDGLQLHSAVVVRSEQGTVDLSPLLSELPKSMYAVRLIGMHTKREPSPTDKAEFKIAWDPSAKQPAISPALNACLYNLELRDAAPGSEPIGCLLLVCNAQEFVSIEQEFANGAKQLNSWPEEIRDAVGEKNRRALVLSLADEAPNGGE